jgi:peroxiredoxin
MELEALQQVLPEIRATGAQLVALSPQREAYLRQMAEKNHIEFELVTDAGNVVAGRFGLVFSLPSDLREVYRSFGTDLTRFNGDDSWTLPMPGRFVIDQAGIIRHVDVDADYTVRPEPMETVAFLKKLAVNRD